MPDGTRSRERGQGTRGLTGRHDTLFPRRETYGNSDTSTVDFGSQGLWVVYASMHSHELTLGLPASVPNAKSNAAIPDKTRAGRRCCCLDMLVKCLWYAVKKGLRLVREDLGDVGSRSVDTPRAPFVLGAWLGALCM